MSSNTADDYDRRFWQQTTSRYHYNSKIYLITIIIFSSIIFLVFFYYLYVRFILGRREPSSSSSSVPLHGVSQPPKRGLDPLLIASLPTFIVQVNATKQSQPINKDDIDKLQTGSATTECAVCLQVLQEKETARMLPNCKHVFHVTCVDAWLVTRSTCPVCRSEVKPRLDTEPREGPVREVDLQPLDLTAETSSSGSRLDMFRKMLTKERSLNKNQSRIDRDLERH